MVKLAVRVERCQRLSLCLVKQIFFVSRHNEHAVLLVPTLLYQSTLISQSPSETRAVTSDFRK